MGIKVGKNQKVKNQVLFFSKPADLALPYLVRFAEIDMGLKKDEEGKVAVLPLIEEGELTHYILVRYKNLKVLEQKLDILFIPKIKQAFESLGKSFVLDLDKTPFGDSLKRNIGDLLALALYRFERYKKEKRKHYLWINDSSRSKKEFEAMVESLQFVRDLVNEPPSEVNPESVEKIIKQLFEDKKDVKIEVIKGQKLKKLGLNGIWAVGSGSQYEPRLVIVRYMPVKSQKPVGLVGKGVTFDS